MSEVYDNPRGMQEARSVEVTLLLKRISAGDRSAADELIPAVYAELRAIALKRIRRERPGHTLQPTALVNEAWLRIFAGSSPSFADRAHFLATASRVMHRILVDHARARSAARRGGGARGANVVPDSRLVSVGDGDPVDVLYIHEAIEALALGHPASAQALEMHFFGGMTIEETAVASSRPVEDVRYDLRFGRAWLRRRLHAASGRSPP